MKCDQCFEKGCADGEPCAPRDWEDIYTDEEDIKVMRTAAEVEDEFYGVYNRIEEIVVFAKRMGYKKIGIAFCVGLSGEANKIASILRDYFEVESVCCKVSGVSKCEMGLPKAETAGPISCNPIEQARIFKEAGTDLNLLLGLCVGHDALFIKHSHTYVIPVAVKDRVTGNNPLAAVYASSPYKRMKKKKLA